MSGEDIDFEEQLRLEKLSEEEEKEKEKSVKTKVDEDGTEYEWDAQKKAWFPKIDDEFLASYQMNYGSSNTSDVASGTTNTSSSHSGVPDPSDPNYYYWYHYYYGSQENTDSKTEGHDSISENKNNQNAANNSTATNPNFDPSSAEYYHQYYSHYGYDNGGTEEDVGGNDNDESGKDVTANEEGKGKDKKALKPKQKEPPTWFEMQDVNNTNVYVSGLPPDITDDEFKELMNKCGLIMQDHDSRKMKIKLYKDQDGKNKGDGRCCYIKKESVDLALQILDGSEVKGHKISVELAKFEVKGSFDPDKRKKQKSNKLKRKLKEKQEKLFDWRPDQPIFGSRPKSDKVVIIENLFDHTEFERDPALINEYRDDIRNECHKYGEVKKVVIYDQNPDGVAQVSFGQVDEADQCIIALNSRWFAKRRLFVHVWDGKKKYEVEETEQEREARLKKWQSFLESDGNKAEDKSNVCEEDKETLQKADKGTLQKADKGTLQKAD